MGPVKTVMIIAGESSGDHHGAKLVRAMRKRDSELFFCGIGGPALEKEGVRIIFDASLLSVVGITEILGVFPDILKGLATVKRLLKSLRPDLLLLIDFPDFNLRAAAMAKKLGVPVLYYVSPQIWAWRGGRVKKIKKLVDHMAVIFPFEIALYEKHGVPATFVGHPLLDDAPGTSAEKKSAIGILPGSRRKEIRRHLPVMIEAALILERRLDSPEFLISCARGIEMEYIENIMSERQKLKNFKIVPSGVDKTLHKSRLAIAVSGTVTLEAAIAEVPHIIIYKVSTISYWLARALINVESIGISNLIAGTPHVPELIQKEASPGNIAELAYEIFTDDDKIKKAMGRLREIKRALGGSGASDRAAEIAFGMF